MTNKELAAQCLIEAANILNDKEEVIEESYGAHGVFTKTLEEMHKKEKAKNDAYDKEVNHKRKAYERAGFEDRVKPANRDYEESIKNALDDDKELRSKNGVARGKKYSGYSNSEKASVLNRQAAYDAAEKINNAKMDRNRRTNPINYELHERINKRTGKPVIESVYDIFDDIDFSDILD